MYADLLLEPWYRTLLEELPDLALYDVHTHLGEDDPDGFTCRPAEHREALGMVGARAVVFPMQEPGGYREANERMIAEAAASGGRLQAFCRLDPHREPVAEAERCLAAGARGFKLHPRAEGFSLDHPDVAQVFALAHEHRLPVLIHAGRGIPALGRHALALAERFPEARVILAHAGISDLAWLWRPARERPNLFFDTAWWNPADLMPLFALVPPGQILFGSDLPYGTPLQSAVLVFRCALEAGLSAAQIRSVAGEQTARLMAGEEPADAGPAPGTAEARVDLLLERVHGFLLTAIARTLVGDSGEEAIALARLACEVGDEAPQGPVCRSVLALLDRHAEFQPEAARIAQAHGGEGRQFPGLQLMVAAAAVARTPSVAVPPDPEPVSAGERLG